MLEGFEKYTLTKGAPSITISENGTSFNKTAVMKMKKTECVLLLINEDQRKIAIQKCDKTEEGATPFYRETKRGIIAVRWGNRELVDDIFTLMDWEREKTYKANGKFEPEDDAIIFDLSEANVVGENKE